MVQNRFAGGRALTTEGSLELSAIAGESSGVVYADPNSTAVVPDGTAGAPFKTVAAALAAVTAVKKTVFLMPGTYEETVALTWPKISGVALVGLGPVTVRGASGATNALTIAPGAVSATFEAFIENIQLSHRTGQAGLSLDNTAMTKKLNVYLKNFGTEQEGTGNSIVTTHGDTANAIRIYAEAQMHEIEGPVSIAIGNNGDRVIFANQTLSGGLVSSADAVVSEITLKCCQILHEGVTGGNAAQVLNSIRSWTLTGATYAAVDTNDLAGSHTENII